MSRAINRHQRARLKRRRRFYGGRDLRQDPRQLGRVIDTPTPCSCLMCGNARAHAGRTVQERRADDVWCDALP